MKGATMKDQHRTASAADDLVADYHEWLVSERGLAASTIKYYVDDARQFLGEQDGRELADLAFSDVRAFMVRECARRTTGSARKLATSLRSLLRYLHLAGITNAELAQAVPAPKHWRGSWLPRGLSAEEVAAVVVASDRDTATGRRDYAIVVILARLGLRAAEVAALSLDDLDWSRGEIIVRGKANHTERLPLPVDVGEALVAYLRHGRPQASCRSLLLRAAGPKVGLSPLAVSNVVRRACVRAGLAPQGAHRLRHSAATALLRAGGSMDEVSQVLRQHASQVTAHYAKVDFDRLRTLALPWPGAVA
jgi:site-specific recombinase XerD